MGGLSISVYSRVQVDDGEIRVRWVLDMGETAAATVLELIDADTNGTVTPAEKEAYLSVWISSVLEHIELTVDGIALPMQVGFHELTSPVGEGGVLALRVVIDLSAELPSIPSGNTYLATYRDTNYDTYIGWREVVVTRAPSVHLVTSSVPSEDRTDELRTYPPDLWAAAPNSEARFTVRSGPPPQASTVPGTADGGPSSSGIQVWPTGVLALVLIVLLITVIALADRGHEPTGTRRR